LPPSLAITNSTHIVKKTQWPADTDPSGECKNLMTSYLRCLRAQKGTNAPECRLHAKEYLTCRMERNLMAPDEFRNLGFKEDEFGREKGVAAATDRPGTRIGGSEGGGK